MSESKDALRKEAARCRGLLTPRFEDADEAAVLFFETLDPQENQVIAAYWPKEREFSPLPILERAMDKRIACALPVIQKGDKVLKFARWRDGDALTKNAQGVLEPASKDWLEPDIVIVPLLAFDRRGYRLGYGGGYYDATLRALRAKKNIIAAGIAYAEQAVLFNLPAETHDEKLDYVITPQRVHKFD